VLQKDFTARIEKLTKSGKDQSSSWEMSFSTIQSALKEELAALELSMTNQLNAVEAHTKQGLSAVHTQID
jgi:hypothetical protein